MSLAQYLKNAEAMGLKPWEPMGDIPKGLCQCGCGEQTSIATKNSFARGNIRGLPIRFRLGHSTRLPEFKKQPMGNISRSLTAQKYRTTDSVLAKLKADQGGKCAICPNGLAYAVDHCHTTGKVRGYLCSHCNLMLGHAQDNPEVLRRAAQYLEDNS